MCSFNIQVENIINLSNPKSKEGQGNLEKAVKETQTRQTETKSSTFPYESCPIMWGYMKGCHKYGASVNCGTMMGHRQ